MLAFLSRTSRSASLRSAPPASRRTMDALVAKVLEQTKLAHVGQLLDIVVSNDAEFAKHIDAFGAVLVEATTEPTRHLPEEALRLVVKAMELNDQLDAAMKEADYADLFGRPSVYQSTLRMRASAVYDQEGPPPEIIELIAAFQKAVLAYCLLMYAGSHRPDASPELLTHLAQLFHDGIVARLRHLASLGYTVDEATVPTDQRLDLEAIHAEHQAWEESLRREVDEFAAQRPAWASDDDPDLDTLEGTLRDALARRGHDPADVLRRATANVHRAQNDRQPPTDEDVQRAAGWVLGRT